MLFRSNKSKSNQSSPLNQHYIKKKIPIQSSLIGSKSPNSPSKFANRPKPILSSMSRLFIPNTDSLSNSIDLKAQSIYFKFNKKKIPQIKEKNKNFIKSMDTVIDKFLDTRALSPKHLNKLLEERKSIDCLIGIDLSEFGTREDYLNRKKELQSLTKSLIKYQKEIMEQKNIIQKLRHSSFKLKTQVQDPLEVH